MRIHHLNCGTLHPLSGRMGAPARIVCHCLLLETAHSLVLVDAGVGTSDIAEGRLGFMFHRVMQPVLQHTETAIAQVKALGFDPADVGHIVLTHLDLDHAGGLSDFPAAVVHVHRHELQAATHPPTFLERHRYRKAQFAHQPRFATYAESGEPWNGFDCVRQLDGLPPEILLVPLFGHSRGHSAVAVQSGDGWLLHCGDAYFDPGDLSDTSPRMIRFFRDTVAALPDDERTNRARLRVLWDENRGVRLFSSHSAAEFDAFVASPADGPREAAEVA